MSLFILNAPLVAELVDIDELDIEESHPQGSSAKRPKESGRPKPSRKQNKSTVTPKKVRESSSSKPVLEQVPQKKKSNKKPNQKNKKLPVKFEGEILSGRQKDGIIQLDEKVWIRQGGLEIRSGHAKLFFEETNSEVVRVEAHDKVKLVQRNEESGEYVRAYGDKVIYDAKTEKAILTGNAVLYRGADIVRGERIDYEVSTGVFKASRVKGVVKPGKNNRE